MVTLHDCSDHSDSSDSNSDTNNDNCSNISKTNPKEQIEELSQKLSEIKFEFQKLENQKIMNENKIKSSLNQTNENKIKTTSKSSTHMNLRLPNMPTLYQPIQDDGKDQDDVSQDDCQDDEKKEEMETPNNEKKDEEKIGKGLNSMDVKSLLNLLQHIQSYCKEMEIEKKRNEEFRETLLESISAQNSQILSLCSQIGSQQNEIKELKAELNYFKTKFRETETTKDKGPKKQLNDMYNTDWSQMAQLLCKKDGYKDNQISNSSDEPRYSQKKHIPEAEPRAFLPSRKHIIPTPFPKNDTFSPTNGCVVGTRFDEDIGDVCPKHVRVEKVNWNH